MDAIKFIKERDRMCKSYYDAEKGRCSDGCPAHDVQCSDLDDLSTDAEELVTLVEEWSAAHPRKTRQSVFLEQWPQADIDNTGLLILCPKRISADIRVTVDCLRRGAPIVAASSGCRRWSSGLVICLARRVLYCAAYYRHIHDV